MIARRVGSVTMAASARTPLSTSRRVPMLSYSSSTTAATMISRVPSPSGASKSAARAAAAHIAATPDFMSDEPRPYIRPSRSAASHGSCVMPSTPTTSKWPLNMSVEPPVLREPTRAMTFARPGTTSCISTAIPHAVRISHSARATAASPGPPLTSDGFRESIRTSSRVRATASPRATRIVLLRAGRSRTREFRRAVRRRREHPPLCRRGRSRARSHRLTLPALLRPTHLPPALGKRSHR